MNRELSPHKRVLFVDFQPCEKPRIYGNEGSSRRCEGDFDPGEELYNALMHPSVTSLRIYKRRLKERGIDVKITRKNGILYLVKDEHGNKVWKKGASLGVEFTLEGLRAIFAHRKGV